MTGFRITIFNQIQTLPAKNLVLTHIVPPAQSYNPAPRNTIASGAENSYDIEIDGDSLTCIPEYEVKDSQGNSYGTISIFVEKVPNKSLYTTSKHPQGVTVAIQSAAGIPDYFTIVVRCS